MVFINLLSSLRRRSEVIAWLKENKYSAAISAGTIWILLDGPNVLGHELYADDCLYQTVQTYNTAMFLSFQKQFKKFFDFRSGNVSVYLGNRIKPLNHKYSSDSVFR